MTAMDRTLPAHATRAVATKAAGRSRSKVTAAHLPDECSSAGRDIEAEIAGLESLPIEDLRLRWRNHWGRLAPAALPRNLLFRLMAYRVQAERFGDLDRATIRILGRLAEAEKSASDPSPSAASNGSMDGSSAPARRADDPLILKPGTLLVRDWQGRLEHVMVVHDGFAWNGATYGSLSAVALAITGTKWSGHRFFGVRHQDRVKSDGRRGERDPRNHNEFPIVLPPGDVDDRPLALHSSPFPLLGGTTAPRESVR